MLCRRASVLSWTFWIWLIITYKACLSDWLKCMNIKAVNLLTLRSFKACSESSFELFGFSMLGLGFGRSKVHLDLKDMAREVITSNKITRIYFVWSEKGRGINKLWMKMILRILIDQSGILGCFNGRINPVTWCGYLELSAKPFVSKINITLIQKQRKTLLCSPKGSWTYANSECLGN